MNTALEAWVVERWLAEQPFSLWADFDISRTDRRKLAADWFVKQFDAFSRWLEANEDRLERDLLGLVQRQQRESARAHSG